ncbi:craniofacial development protein 2-like protein [Tanacetum coccineum]
MDHHLRRVEDPLIKVNLIQVYPPPQPPQTVGGGLGRYSESRSGRSGSRVKAFRRIRVGRTKWKGSSNKEVNGYKLCDRIISLTLVIEGETVNVISAYAPQVGLSEEEKKAFWDSLDEVVRESPTDQRLILGGDLNGHIGASTVRIPGCTDGFRVLDVRNEEGHLILDFATAHDLAVANSYFKKRDHHLITFQSGGHCTQIDYLLVRRGDLKACKDCKVFPREACSSQHRLLAMDTLFKRVQRRRVGSAASRILWKNLNGDAAEAFRSRVSDGVSVSRDSCDICLGNLGYVCIQMMKGYDIGIQEKKAKLFNEWERFTSTDGESIESYYHRFSKLMNDFKRNKLSLK